jgi:hypothetical protein
MEELPAALAGKIVYIQYDLKAPMRLAGTPNEKAFFLLLQYNPIAIIYTNPLTSFVTHFFFTQTNRQRFAAAKSMREEKSLLRFFSPSELLYVTLSLTILINQMYQELLNR